MGPGGGVRAGGVRGGRSGDICMGKAESVSRRFLGNELGAEVGEVGIDHT